MLDSWHKTHPAGVTGTLLAHRHVFKAFLTSRVGNEADAEDLLPAVGRTPHCRTTALLGCKPRRYFLLTIRAEALDLT
jgi:hypothetical protein